MSVYKACTDRNTAATATVQAKHAALRVGPRPHRTAVRPAGSANAAGGDDGAAGGTGGEGRSDLDSHVGRRKVSTYSRRRVKLFAQRSAMGVSEP